MTPGSRFATALAAKDAAALRAVLHPDVDFRALTPRRAWEATSAAAVVDEVVLGLWFEEKDHIDELTRVSDGEAVGNRAHVSYRLRVTNPDGTHEVEQQAYYETDGERITWLRVLCSGYCPL